MNNVVCLWDGKAELGEGVCWHEAEQAVYWVDIVGSNLHRLNANGSVENWHFPGQLSAVAPCSCGTLLASFENGLFHLDLETGTTSSTLTLESELVDNRFNDGCADRLGQFWFGSMDTNERDNSGSFYRLNLHGEVEQFTGLGQFCITNGPAFSADGQWMYFTDTLERTVFRASLDTAGRPDKVSAYITFGDADGYPDGMCCDTDGGLWVCHFGGACITRFLADGSRAESVPVPAPNVTKCAFGGSNLNTLYITTAAKSLSDADRATYPKSGGLFAIDLPYSGIAPTLVAHPQAQR